MQRFKPVPILLVDDLEENLISLEALLKREELLLLKARSGDEALELLLQHDVALALVDVQMPGLSGYELAELMRGNERTRRVPIIFVTAGIADGARGFRGYEAGAVDFIQKPIEPDILRSKVDVFFELYVQRKLLAVQRDELAAHAAALEEASRAKDILLREINHRIKNLFSLTGGLISVSARSASSVSELATDLRSRMNALARAHDLTLPDLSGASDLAATGTRRLLNSSMPSSNPIARRAGRLSAFPGTMPRCAAAPSPPLPCCCMSWRPTRSNMALWRLPRESSRSPWRGRTSTCI